MRSAAAMGVGNTLVEVELEDQRWMDVWEAYRFVKARRALIIEGSAYRVERGPGPDITITMRERA